MGNVNLQCATGDAATDAHLRAIVARYEATFTNLILGYYLFGSHADGSAVPASDLDLFVVFRGNGATSEVVAAATALAAAWSREHGAHLDVVALGEAALRRDGHFRLRHGSVLLHGTDLRADLPDIAPDEYVRTYAQAPFGYAARGFRRTDRLAYPLTYPDPDAEFCGYVLDNPEPVKAFVAAACWDASLLVTFATGLTIATKAASVELYREHVGGPWADYLAALYEQGKRRGGTKSPRRWAIAPRCGPSADTTWRSRTIILPATGASCSTLSGATIRPAAATPPRAWARYTTRMKRSGQRWRR